MRFPPGMGWMGGLSDSHRLSLRRSCVHETVIWRMHYLLCQPNREHLSGMEACIVMGHMVFFPLIVGASLDNPCRVTSIVLFEIIPRGMLNTSSFCCPLACAPSHLITVTVESLLLFFCALNYAVVNDLHSIS